MSRKIAVTGDGGERLSEVSVEVAPAPGSKTAAIIAHGAGGNMDGPAIEGLASRLAAGGVTAVRFNFIYSERKKGSPDREAVLIACWRSIADWVRSEIRPDRLFVGGRSMGGRMASYLVAGGYPVDGIFFVAYPLHPPGKTDRQRKEHLPGIKVPMLFVSGTDDAFARRDLLEPLVKGLGARLHLIEGADHGFKVGKKFGRSARDVEDEVARIVLAFIQSGGG